MRACACVDARADVSCTYGTPSDGDDVHTQSRECTADARGGGTDWNNTFMFNRNRGAWPTTTRNHPPISEINLLINIPSLREYYVREIDEPHIDRIYISRRFTLFYFFHFFLVSFFFLLFFSFFPLPPISTFVVLTALLYGRSLVKRTFLLAKSFATATYYHAS